MSKIIAFVAPKQYGKSTACAILKKHWGDIVTQVNFKDPLIKEIKQNFPDLLHTIAWEESEKIGEDISIDALFQMKPPLIRTLLQNYGTEVRRRDNPDYWVDAWKLSCVEALQQGKIVIVDDARFKNEVQQVTSWGGISIRLDRTDKTSTDTHISETEQAGIECDHTITVGEGEFDELERQLLQIMQPLVQ